MNLFPVISIFAIFSLIMMALAILAFRSDRREYGQPTWWWMMGFISMAFAANARGIYWDVFWSILRHSDRGAADQWSDATGGTAINILFYVPMIFGAYCLLKSRQMMIAEDERQNWPWYKAWLHPDTIRIFRWPRSW